MPDHVQLNPNGGIPSIKLTFGFAQFAKFDIFLWDTNAQNPQPIIENGNNLPGHPDTFQINLPAASLTGRYVTWDAVIASPSGGAGQQYSMTATFIQDGQPVANATFTRSGQMNNTKSELDQARFV